MRNWDSADESGSDSNGCDWKQDWELVQATCRKLDLPLELVDLSADYWNRVFEPALHDWQSGLTPNPDIWCNRYIKFGSLLHRLIPSKDAWLATGHYARVDFSESSDSLGRPRLLRARDRFKDQTYFLSYVLEAALSKSIFPLGGLMKTDVRSLAENWGLPSAKRRESMGICFVGKKRKFPSFVSSYLAPKPGPIVDHVTGSPLGRHSGLWNYTIGQGAKLPGMPTQMFVAQKDLAKNELRLVSGSKHPSLQARVVVCDTWSWIWEGTPHSESLKPSGLPVTVRLARNMSDAPCIMNHNSDTGQTTLTFQEPQLAATPGQVAVAWLDDWCLGCGMITSAETLA